MNKPGNATPSFPRPSAGPLLTACAAWLIALPLLHAQDTWTEVTGPLMARLAESGAETAWPGGCSGVVVDRLTGAVTVKVVGLGLWRSADQGVTWTRVDGDTVSGRDETGWATSIDQEAPARMASFSLDGTAGWTADGARWERFADLGRNWDYGSVDWSARSPRSIIAAKHETDPPGEVYATSDGGATWKQLPIHLQKDRGDVSMVGAMGTETFIYSNGQGILRSADSGGTWTRVSDANPQTRVPVLFRGAHYLGTAAGLVVSKDKGLTWEPQGAEVDIWQGPFFGADENAMVVVGEDGVFRSSDAGATWKRVAGLKPNEDGFQFTPDWFGCYAWDPVHQVLYASSMGNPVYRLALRE
jgi:hypothetical protein